MLKFPVRPFACPALSPILVRHSTIHPISSYSSEIPRMRESAATWGSIWGSLAASSYGTAVVRHRGEQPVQRCPILCGALFAPSPYSVILRSGPLLWTVTCEMPDGNM